MDIEKLNCRCGCGLTPLPAAVEKLKILEDDCGFEFENISGVRCKKHNEKVGGAAKSDHLLGSAFDIQVDDPTERSTIIEKIYYRQLLLSLGGYDNFITWHKIEVCDKHIHISYNIHNSNEQILLWGKSK